MHETSRRTEPRIGTIRAWKRAAAGCLAAVVSLGPASAQETWPSHGSRPIPENARLRPGIDTEGYPPIGRRQAIAVLGETAGASVGAFVRSPLASTGQVIGRGAERLVVRARELTAWAGSAQASSRFGRRGDGVIDAPFGSPRMPATITLLPSSEEAIQRLLALIGSPARRIDLMMYAWEDDPTGREVAQALESAAGRGVRVRLLVDRGAFLLHNPAAAEGRPTFLDRLRVVPGVALIEPDDPFLRFDHRKLAVVDGRVAWTGGMILTEVARRKWENLAFLAEGPVASQYSALFEDRWREVGGAPGLPATDPRLLPSTPTRSNAVVRLVRTDVRERSLKDAIYHAVDHARCRIYLENPYFSDDLLADKLVAARRRGVDVRAVLTLRGNVTSLNRYVVLTANRLLRGGVRVYLAPGMTHVKALSVDGSWCYLGTGNFDELSLRNNREVGLSISSPEVTGALDATLFQPDVAEAQELTGLLPRPEHWPLLRLFALWF